MLIVCNPAKHCDEQECPFLKSFEEQPGIGVIQTAVHVAENDEIDWKSDKETAPACEI